MCTRQFTGAAFILLLVQSITAQCPGHGQNTKPLPPLSRPSSHLPEFVINGGIFAVRSTSPIAPTGVAVHSDKLVIEGPLAVDGQLPFLGTVALEGILPSVGTGTIAHSCGSGIAIAEITPVAGPLLGTSLTPNVGVGIPSGRSCSHIY